MCPQARERPSEGHHICVLCGEYIRPEKGEKRVRYQENIGVTKRGHKYSFRTYAHRTCKKGIPTPRRQELIMARLLERGKFPRRIDMPKKGEKKEGKTVQKSEAAEVTTPEPTIPVPAETEAPQPAKTAKGPTPEQVLAAIPEIKGDVTSTTLRDHFSLDKESGRDVIRRVMKKLEEKGKVVITEKEGAKRKQFVYKLVEK